MAPRSPRRANEVKGQVEAAFRKAGWRVDREPPLGRGKADFIVRRGGNSYVVEVKVASEPRGDRVLPLLAHAILQAKAAARECPGAAPLVVLGPAQAPRSLVESVHRFVSEYAPEVAVAVFTRDGSRVFFGKGLEKLNAGPKPEADSIPAKRPVRPNLFSDLNQWMLKVLLAPRVAEPLLSAPREPFHSASQLARAASVSIMSASRFVRLLAAESFLDESRGEIGLARIGDLMRLWRSEYLRPVRDWPMRWILRGAPDGQLRRALRSHRSSQVSVPRSKSDENARSQPRMCLGLYAAADALGLGIVGGVKPHLFVESAGEKVLSDLGLMRAEAGEPVDVFVRVPAASESVFRGMVVRDGIPVSDVLQVWADVSGHPSRGQVQAAEIERRALSALFGRNG